jgi:dTDP-4-dehydrorhamnose reductase
MKILITGANGFLGQHLTLYLAKRNFTIIATGRGECRIPQQHSFSYFNVDLTDEVAVLEMISNCKPDVIVHTAAMSKPDECENNKDACILNNVTVTDYLVKAANTVLAKFIYVSTDFIFGEDGPHSEDDDSNPLNFYGASKLQAEEIVKAKADNYAIMRPVFMYGKVWDGLRPTFLHWVKHSLEQGKPIRVVNDQLRTPTYVTDLCKGLETIILKNVTGAFHLAGKEILSPYQMAIAIAEAFSLNKNLIESVTADTFPEIVKRSKKSGLKIDKAIKEIDYQPIKFSDGLKLSFE